MKCINLGCGNRFHPDWVNVNFTSSSPRVVAADLSRGIPYPDQSFDLVYHSHLLEHFSKAAAPAFMSECFRVLKPGGIIRVAIPGLEGIVRQYISCLEHARQGDPGAVENYDWMMLELLDQIVRNRPGGEMAVFLSQPEVANERFIVSRCGVEVERFIEAARQQRQPNQPVSSNRPAGIGWRARLIKLFLGKERYKAMQIGQYRMSGENHLWMYDSFSLGRLLAEVGFVNVEERSAHESLIEAWSSFNLDTNSDGSIYKPDSIYMEALRPWSMDK